MTTIYVLSLVFGGGGIVAAIAAFFKVRPERESIMVSTAQGVVVMQASILDELREELERVNDRADELALGQKQLKEELNKVTQERDYLREENRRLNAQVGRLEHRVGELEQENTRR